MQNQPSKLQLFLQKDGGQYILLHDHNESLTCEYSDSRYKKPRVSELQLVSKQSFHYAMKLYKNFVQVKNENPFYQYQLNEITVVGM